MNPDFDSINPLDTNLPLVRTNSSPRIAGSYQKEFRSKLALSGVPYLFENKILAAYDIAKYAHIKQQREGGGRYFQHPASVLLIIACELGCTQNEDILVASILHDAV